MPPLISLPTAPGGLIRLSWIDTSIIAIYFLAVLGIGFYLREQTQTGDDLFLAGREMTAWIAGLGFLSANLLILGAGIGELSAPSPAAIADLHAGIWWGAFLVVIGAVYVYFFRPGRRP
jgi:Na+/proline symporter